MRTNSICWTSLLNHILTNLEGYAAEGSILTFFIKHTWACLRCINTFLFCRVQLTLKKLNMMIGLIVVIIIFNFIAIKTNKRLNLNQIIHIWVFTIFPLDSVKLLLFLFILNIM